MIAGLVQEDPRLSVWDIISRTGLSFCVVRNALKKDLVMARKCCKFVPKELSEVQKWTRMVVSQDNIDKVCAQDDPEAFMRSIITGDKTWISTFETNTKAESSQWVHKGDPRLKKPHQLTFQRKTMATIFFDCDGLLLCEFLAPRDTITAEHYIKTLANLKEVIRKKRPKLWQGHKFILHHDNASPHTAALTMKNLQEWGMTVLEHPPCSPDMAPCDFALFPKLKKEMRGQNFRNVANVQLETKKILTNLPKQVFEDAIFDIVAHWQKCVAVNGEYFEGDSVVIDPLLAKGNSSEDSSEEDSDN